MNKLKVLGYCRVSSEMQKLKNNSVNMQLDYINEYCIRMNYDLVNVFKDEGISGKIKNREGLNNLFDVIKNANATNNNSFNNQNNAVSLNDLREDIVFNSSSIEKQIIIENFPKEKNGYLVVAKVIEE